MIGRTPASPRKAYTFKNSSHTTEPQKGFTLVEVMLAIVLVAIGTALAVPSYNNMVEKRLLVKSTEQMAAFIASVQSVSMLTNRVVTVSYYRGGHRNWCIGAVIDTTACDCRETVSTEPDYCAIDGQQFVFNNGDTNDMRFMHRMTGDGAYSFDPIRGLFQNVNDSLRLDVHADSSDFDLRVQVSNTGRVIVCSRTSGQEVPGYAACT